MAENTITDDASQDTGAAALPDNQEDMSAGQAPDQAQVNDQGTGEQSLPEPDDKLAKFAESHGLELDSPNAVKAAKIAMDNQASYQQAQQKASQLDKSLQTQPQQPANATEADSARIQKMERDLNLMRFKAETSDWKEHEPAMVDLLAETVATPYGQYTRSELVNAGLLGIQDVYRMAKGTAPAKPQENTQEVLQSIANKQRAASLSPNAVNSVPKSKDYDVRDLWDRK